MRHPSLSLLQMDQPYNPTSVEEKWQKKWADAKAYEVDLKNAKNPYFTHVMFPYPSGDKLHIGHWFNYSPADSFARYKRMLGFDVFSPMGFDAFGLPAENYAIKTGVPPQESIPLNVETMITQLKRIGCMYDWNKMVNTSQPAYYQWTQWLFIQMFKNGLAYKKEANVNYCPKDQTVLANEQVKEGCCDRCGTPVIQKSMDQWFWKITKYADRLLAGLDKLDWPQKTKTMQENWIGRSEGVNIKSRVKDLGFEFEVYDSVPQTFMAQTFTVIAPDHPMVAELVKGTVHEKDVAAFAEKIRKKKAEKKFTFDEDMEGIFTGRYVEDPFGTGDLPIWVASFVVMDYGTGIVHCSAHDERDFAFAKKYGIPLRTVMLPEDPFEAEKVKTFEYCYAKDPNGVIQQPEQFKGRKWGEVRMDIIEYMEKKDLAKRTVHYRLRDWSIGRQRYWGAPIPIVYDPEANPHAVPEEHLPWMLPQDVEFKPKGTAPLAQSQELRDRTEKIFGKGWTPEVDTMDTFVCSSFYSLMYLGASHENGVYIEPDVTKNIPVDPEIEKKWMPVSMYIGGAEHACMHLIYARFVMMALKDFGFVTHDEPFKQLIHQGVITNQGAKMSKSKGNVVSPDSFVNFYGSDVFRMYLMFMGPFTYGGDWSDTGIKGVARFVQRTWRMMSANADAKTADGAETITMLHQTIKNVTDSMDRLHFNTAISSLMECLNAFEKKDAINLETVKTFVKLLSPIAPHLAEELWETLKGDGFIIDQKWPTYDPALIQSATMTIAVQVNGKLRGDVVVASDAPKEEIIATAKEIENVKKYLDGVTIKKEIYVINKLVSFVV